MWIFLARVAIIILGSAIADSIFESAIQSERNKADRYRRRREEEHEEAKEEAKKVVKSHQEDLKKIARKQQRQLVREIRRLEKISDILKRSRKIYGKKLTQATRQRIGKCTNLIWDRIRAYQEGKSMLAGVLKKENGLMKKITKELPVAEQEELQELIGGAE